MSELYFLIESGKPLEMVKQHIANVISTQDNNMSLARELGIEKFLISRISGVLTGAIFKGPIHPDFKKPDRKGVSYPKKGTGWDVRMKAQVGCHDQSAEISDAFDIPSCIEYTTPTGKGWHALGTPFAACGYLWISKEGPYAMWIPDVMGEVRKYEADGCKVIGAANDFKPVIEGARLIEKEEWEILVAQDKLKAKAYQREAPAA